MPFNHMHNSFPLLNLSLKQSEIRTCSQYQFAYMIYNEVSLDQQTSAHSKVQWQSEKECCAILAVDMTRRGGLQDKHKWFTAGVRGGNTREGWRWLVGEGSGGEGMGLVAIVVGRGGLQPWRLMEEEVNRCPQAGRQALSGRATERQVDIQEHSGTAVTVKPSRALNVEQKHWSLSHK